MRLNRRSFFAALIGAPVAPKITRRCAQNPFVTAGMDIQRNGIVDSVYSWEPQGYTGRCEYVTGKYDGPDLRVYAERALRANDRGL